MPVSTKGKGRFRTSDARPYGGKADKSGERTGGDAGPYIEADLLIVGGYNMIIKKKRGSGFWDKECYCG